MAQRAPHTVDPEIVFPVGPGASAGLGRIVQPWKGQPAHAVLLGVPSDEGVRLAAGRAGAAGGPAAVRQALGQSGATFDVESGMDFGRLVIADAGDLQVVEGDPAATQDWLAEAVGAVLDAGAVPIVVGGSNDLAFGPIQALVARSRDVGGVNAGAHFDAGPVEHGCSTRETPYRRVLSELEIIGSHFVEFASHGLVNDKRQYDWLVD